MAGMWRREGKIRTTLCQSCSTLHVILMGSSAKVRMTLWGREVHEVNFARRT